jgi:hypothetical protein
MNRGDHEIASIQDPLRIGRRIASVVAPGVPWFPDAIAEVHCIL